MADLAKIQKKRNTLLLAPKRKLTSVVKPTAVDTTPVAPTVPETNVGSYVAPTGPATSVIAPTTTSTPTTTTPAPVTPPPAAQKDNTTTDLLKKAAIIGGTALAGKVLLDKFGKPVTTTTAPATKPPAAPIVKPPTSVVIPPALQKEQDAQVKAANTAKAAADNNALAGSFDQGTRVGLDYNTIPNNTPAQAGTIDESIFDDPNAEYTQDDLGNIYKMIDDKPVLIRSAEVDQDIAEEDYGLFGDTDQGTDVGLDYNTIPNNTPAEAGTIDESMFDDPTGSAEPHPVLVQDDNGNIFIANADGSYTPADADGNPIGDPIFAGGDEVGGGTDYADNGYSDTALDTGGGGGYDAYDDAGNLFHVNDDGSIDLIEPAYQEPAYEPPPYEDPYAGYEDPYAGYEEPSYDDYDLGSYDEPPTYIEPDLSYLDDYKRGGQVQQMKKGGLPHFAEGDGVFSDPDYSKYKDTANDYSINYTSSNPASIDDMSWLYSDPNVEENVFDPRDPNEGENVFNPYDLHADEELMEDELGQKWAMNANGDVRLIEDSPLVTAPETPNVDPTKPKNPMPGVKTGTGTSPPPNTETKSGGFNYKDLFSADNIKALAGAGLGAAGLMTLYNSFKDKESTYKPAAYTPPAIPKRTTDFGMGPAKTVTPTMGGLQTMTPSQQEELYTNLGVPGYEMEHEDPVENTAVDQPMADGGFAQPQTSQPNSSYFTYGIPQDPLEVLGVKQPQQKSDGGGLQMRQGGLPHPTAGVPIVQGRQDYRQGAAVSGEGDGQSDDIPAMLADGEYVFDSDVVAALGNGSNKAGAEVLDRFREEIRAHKRSAPIGKIPPKAKSPLAYLKEAT